MVERDLAKVEVAGSSPVIRSNGLVVQLVRTLACHARGQGFEPPSGRQKPLHLQGLFNLYFARFVLKEFQVIARMRSDFSTKFAIPRQSGILGRLESRIEFEKEFQNPDFIKGIDGFSHLWILWYFSENDREKISPTVRPPRLGGNRRVGVFATRSPFRPNPIGLSSVRLERIEDGEKGKVLVVSGADLMDGTPIFDIKPYIPFSDSHPDAVGGFADEHFSDGLEVLISDEIKEAFPREKYSSLLEILRQDPRPSYHSDPERIYGFSFAGFEIKFRVKENELCVVSIENESLV